MFKYRFITTLISIPCIIIILFLLPILEFKIIALLTCILSAWEWGKLSRFSSRTQIKWLGLIFSLLLTIFYINTFSLFFDIKNNQFIGYAILAWWLIALILIIFYPNSAILWNKSIVVICLIGIFIILPFFWGISILRNYCYNENHYIGAWLLLYIIVLVWGMDSFSYIIGSTLGYHKITPKLSPRKTWEGYIGGLLIMIIVCWVSSKYISVKIKPYTDIESQKLFFYSIIVVLSSILGDLTESMFKREAGFKDSSQLIPGHGGILDAIDSLYSTIPIFTSLMILTI